jgi:hypothetical protein
MISWNLRDLLHGQVGKLFPLECPAGIHADQMTGFSLAIAAAHQTASLDEFAMCMDPGHGVAERERGELLAAGSEERIGAIKSAPAWSCAILAKAASRSLSLVFSAGGSPAAVMSPFTSMPGNGS